MELHISLISSHNHITEIWVPILPFHKNVGTEDILQYVHFIAIQCQEFEFRFICENKEFFVNNENITGFELGRKSRLAIFLEENFEILARKTPNRHLKVTGHPFWRFVENRHCALKISPIFIKFSPNVSQCMQNMIKL